MARIGMKSLLVISLMVFVAFVQAQDTPPEIPSDCETKCIMTCAKFAFFFKPCFSLCKLKCKIIPMEKTLNCVHACAQSMPEVFHTGKYLLTFLFF